MTPDETQAGSSRTDPVDVPEMTRAPDAAPNEWNGLESDRTPKDGPNEHSPEPAVDNLLQLGRRPVAGAPTVPASPIALSPRPPIAKRLNRNALTVAAVIAGVTVLVAVVLVQPSKTAASAGSSVGASPATPPLPARPTFLDQPPKALSAPTSPDSVTGGHAPNAAPSSRPNGPAQSREPNQPALQLPTPALASATPPSGVGAAPPPGAYAAALGTPSLDQVGGPGGAMGGPLMMPGASGGQPSGGPSARHIAYQAALVSPVLIEDRASRPSLGRESGEAVADAEAGSTAASPTSVMSPLDPRAAQSLGNSSGLVPPFVGPGATPDAAHRTPAAPEQVSLSAHLEPAGTPLTLRAGTLIPGLLLTGVNSDLPGQVLAQTSRDVFDSRTEQQLLIPKGSRLVGAYDSHTVGSGRLVVTWTRLILPDGRSLRLPGLPAQDETGQTGVHDQVNHHYGRIYGNALLLSVLSAGLQLSQQQQTTAFAAPSTRQVAAGAVGQELADVSTESIRRGMDIPPTITIRPGMPFNVFLTGDIAFGAPYTPAP